MVRRATAAGLVLLAARAAWGSPRSAAEGAADLTALQRDVAADLRAGKPLVVQVHVPLCDNHLIRCGGHGLGDGDDLARNLYWSTSGGFRGWFGRRGSGWTQVARLEGPEPDVLEIRVWHRRFAPAGALRASGARAPFSVYVVAYAWRGAAIRSAMAAYARDLFGGSGEARPVAIGRDTVLQAGGAARLVAFVGHDGWMDAPRFVWPVPAADAPRKGTLAVACITTGYLLPAAVSDRRVPLLFTRTLLFAGAHSMEGAVSAFAGGADLAEIRERAARAYAAGEGKPVERVRGAFTNPADRRWPLGGAAGR